MTGQGETVQLFNHVGATGFRGLEGWDGPPSQLNLYETPLLSSLLPAEALGRGRERSNGFGKEMFPSLPPPGLQPWRVLSARLPVSLLLRAGCSPRIPPCRVDAFPLAHSFFRPFFLAGGRLPIELHAEHTSRAECVRAAWSLRTCCDDGPALCLPCPGGPVWLLARQCGWCDERTKFLI